MKQFRDMYINSNGFDIADLMEQISKQPSMYWQRSKEREETASSLGEQAYCFERTASEGIEAAGLVIFNKESDIWYVTNIIPTIQNELSFDEYNAILMDFYNFILPITSKNGVEIKVTNDIFFIADIVGERAAKLLTSFSKLANKSTGSSHPSDRKRWFDFILCLDDNNIQLDATILANELMDSGWSEEKSHKLAIEFEFAIELLDYKKDR